ncbi:MAG: ComF family protein [Pyrinomonadaceae bacterium]
MTLIYPRGCQLCGASVESFANGAACAACWSKTQIFDGSETLCQKCGRLLKHAGVRGDKIFCHCCDDDFYQSARAVGVYEGALRVAVLELKEKPFIPSKLKDLLVQAFQQFPLNEATKIVPVPLHPQRLRERGFNQAAILARTLSRHIGLPVLENCLTREIYTRQHRGAMDEKARRESVAKVFAVQQPRLVENQTILLVDDVFTSGATASVCAQALQENGARTVFVLTVARAV